MVYGVNSFVEELYQFPLCAFRGQTAAGRVGTGAVGRGLHAAKKRKSASQ